MADIKQAAKWMKEGRDVTRKDWNDDPENETNETLSYWQVSDKPHAPINENHGGHPFVRVEDLLADDWEIAG